MAGKRTKATTEAAAARRRQSEEGYGLQRASNGTFLKKDQRSAQRSVKPPIGQRREKPGKAAVLEPAASGNRLRDTYLKSLLPLGTTDTRNITFTEDLTPDPHADPTDDLRYRVGSVHSPR